VIKKDVVNPTRTNNFIKGEIKITKHGKKSQVIALPDTTDMTNKINMGNIIILSSLLF